MEDIEYKVFKDFIRLSLPTKNKGKFRWKNRLDNSQYGEVFATTKIPFSDNSYIEWQIGYDSEVEHETKKTLLADKIFEGANGKKKNPYELSEILYLLTNYNILDKSKILSLIDQIRNKDFSFSDSFQIKNLKSEDFFIDNIHFHKQDIVLPTFSFYQNPKGISIDISIQKQQYASGVQPMVYLEIPISQLENHEEMLGKTSNEVNGAFLNLNSNNAKVILDLFVFFGMCSYKHKHDVLEILKLLSNY